jgi:hypothetical protein
MREGDVGSQSADTTKLSSEAQLFEVGGCLVAAFGWTPRKCPVASSWPEARANEAVGEAKITKNARAIFAEGFMRRKLH